MGIVTGYGMDIITVLRGPRQLIANCDWLRVGNYDRSKRAEIAQCV